VHQVQYCPCRAFTARQVHCSRYSGSLYIVCDDRSCSRVATAIVRKGSTKFRYIFEAAPRGHPKQALPPLVLCQGRVVPVQYLLTNLIVALPTPPGTAPGHHTAPPPQNIRLQPVSGLLTVAHSTPPPTPTHTCWHVVIPFITHDWTLTDALPLNTPTQPTCAPPCSRMRGRWRAGSPGTCTGPGGPPVQPPAAQGWQQRPCLTTQQTDTRAGEVVMTAAAAAAGRALLGLT